MLKHRASFREQIRYANYFPRFHTFPHPMGTREEILISKLPPSLSNNHVFNKTYANDVTQNNKYSSTDEIIPSVRNLIPLINKP